MACPHTCGALSLLLSGCKQRNIKYSPFFVKRSLTASAKKLQHVCQYAQVKALMILLIIKKKSRIFFDQKF